MYQTTLHSEMSWNSCSSSQTFFSIFRSRETQQFSKISHRKPSTQRVHIRKCRRFASSVNPSHSLHLSIFQDHHRSTIYLAFQIIVAHFTPAITLLNVNIRSHTNGMNLMIQMFMQSTMKRVSYLRMHMCYSMNDNNREEGFFIVFLLKLNSFSISDLPNDEYFQNCSPFEFVFIVLTYTML